MRIVRKIILVFFVTLAILFLAAVSLSYFFSEEVKEMAIRTINKNLKTEVKAGEINFSFLKKFPYASVEFRDVLVQGALTDEPLPLLKAKKAYLLFSLSNIFKKNYSVKKILFEEGELRLLIDEVGNENYDIFKKNEKDTSGIMLEVEKLQLENFLVAYEDRIKKQDYLFKNVESAISGNLAAEVFDMSVNASMLVDHLKTGNINYIDQKEAKVEAGLKVNNKTATYQFDHAKVKLAGLDLQTEGIVESLESGNRIDISVKSKNASLENLLSLIPGKYLSRLKNFHHAGTLYFSSKISGISDQKNSPAVEINFGTGEATLISSESGDELRHIRFDAIYHSRKSASNSSDLLQVKNFSALLQGKPVTGNIEIENFSKPLLHLVADGELNLNVLSHFYMPDTLQSMSGSLAIHGSFKGKAGEPSTYVASGTISGTGISFRLKQKEMSFTGFNGQCELDGNNLMVTQFNGRAGSSDFSMNGKISNLVSWLLFDKQHLWMDGEINSSMINLDELIGHDSISTSGKSVYRLDFSGDLDAHIRLKVDRLQFRKFHATDIHGSLSLSNRVLETSSLLFKSMDGEVYLQGNIDATHPDSLTIAYDASVKKLDITKLFDQMGNFGQQVLLDKNIRGSVTATVQLASRWSKELEVNTRRIAVAGDITIENGELINFKPLLALAKYVKGSDLNDVKFSTLKNRIEIRDRKIYIPEMEINSSALNLSGSGIHTFDNMVDYKIRMKLSQILGRKVKERNTEFGTIEEDDHGGMNLYLTMKGPMDNPKFSYDRKSVEQKIVSTIKQEKKTFWKIVKEEFNGQNKKTPADSVHAPKKKKEELQIETEPDNQ